MPPSSLQVEMDKCIHDFFVNLRRIAIAALVKTEITSEEKFALCWASGVPVEWKDGKFKTTVKCNVVRLEDCWKIVQQEKDTDAAL